MTISEIVEQIKTLSLQERKELAKLLIDLLDAPQEIEAAESVESSAEHWGKSLNRLMDEIGSIEMLYPEIEDPVEWVRRLRQDQQRQRLGDWGTDE